MARLDLRRDPALDFRAAHGQCESLGKEKVSLYQYFVAQLRSKRIETRSDANFPVVGPWHGLGRVASRWGVTAGKHTRTKNREQRLKYSHSIYLSPLTSRKHVCSVKSGETILANRLLPPLLTTSRTLALVGVVLFDVLSISPALADTGNVTTVTTVVPPLTLSQPADMRFGTIIPSGAAGSVTLVLPAALSATPPTTAVPTIVGTRTSTAAITLVGGATCSATVLCGAGSIQVSGQPSGSFGTVTLPATVTLTSGANTIVVDTLTKRYGAAATGGVTTGMGAISATGTATILFAGRLVVGATQAEGTYSGTMVVTVDY
jgi:Domain of unknown function (DUF4402)